MALRVGNEGSVIRFRIFDRGELVPLTGATVTVKLIRPGATSITKNTTIEGSVCSITLSTSDIPNVGTYEMQPIITYTDGRNFAADPKTFPVEGRI